MKGVMGMGNLPTPKKDAEENMQRLISQYGDSLLRFCFLYLHDIQLAEDAVQETYIKVYKNYDSFRGSCNEKTWVTSIAANVCKSQLRSSWYSKVLPGYDFVNEPAAEEPYFDDTLIKAIAELKPKYREAVLLYYYQELTVKEIAHALNLTESAVFVRLNRARKQLKNSLEGWYFNEEIKGSY